MINYKFYKMGCNRSVNAEGCSHGYHTYYQDCCLTKGAVIGLWTAFTLFWLLIIAYALWRARVKAQRRNEMLIKATLRPDPFVYN